MQRQRVYRFLTGIIDNIDKERQDLLNQDPLPVLDKTYATINREINRHDIMTDASHWKQVPQ